ncbi:CoxG family protein [Oceanobacillus halophilus]|uniref:SRPBCC family protein n=1 Tax=Oceanobacillus halophilus TaxID=930130 RepID=A0A495A7G9_9BACI|nr:SRPBCC family protein [Oceanobacillus halophilus]RKQ35679.1 SRPBCC family protein [Oceanobacillus halophilus]
MAKGVHQVELETPISTIWDFVSNMNNWAPLVPGYVDHKIIDERNSIWKIHGDIGVMQKTITLKIRITEWIEPETVVFHVTSSNDTCKGNGYFKAKAVSKSKTKMTGCLNVTVKGMMGTMINPVLKTFVPKVGKDFTEKVAAKIVERDTVRATI